MLKSPSSILNSIQRMKTNLRNDKENLKRMKNNFVYLQEPRHKFSTNQDKQEFSTRSKSVNQLNNKSLTISIDYENKENNLKMSNESSVYDVNNSFKHSNRLPFQQQQQVYTFSRISIKQVDQGNILAQKTSFHKNQGNCRKQAFNDQNALNKEAAMKKLRLRYHEQLQKVKHQAEDKHLKLTEEMNSKQQSQKVQYQAKIKELQEYVEMLEGQVSDLGPKEPQSQKKLNKSIQFSEKKSILSEENVQKAHQQTQTQLNQLGQSQGSPQCFSHLTSIASNNQCHTIIQESFCSCSVQQSKINSQSFPNQPTGHINGLNINQNDLIEQLCMRFFGQNNSKPNKAHQAQTVSGKNEQLNLEQRKRYEQIINCLLEQNTKLQLKLQKIYTQSHQSQNSSQNPKHSFFKNHNINYRTVTSHGDSEQNSEVINSSSSIVFNTGKNSSNILKKYSSNHNCPPASIPSNRSSSQVNNQSSSASQYTSRSISNFQTNRQSVESKNKKSIIYQITNSMFNSSQSSNGMKRTHSKSKIPSKKPPSGVQSSLRMIKTQLNTNPINTKKSDLTQRYKTQMYDHEPQSHRMDFFDDNSSRRNEQSQGVVPTVHGGTGKDRSFKFYDDQSYHSKGKINQNKKTIAQHNCQKQNEFQDYTESEILNDQMKLRTIKTFKCFIKQ